MVFIQGYSSPRIFLVVAGLPDQIGLIIGSVLKSGQYRVFDGEEFAKKNTYPEFRVSV